MGTLTGPRGKRLRDALTRAYSESTFRMFLYESLDKDLADLSASSEPFPGRVFQVIQRASEEDWERQLIMAACTDRPKNVALLELAAELGLVDDAAGPARPEGGQGALQRFIIESSGLDDPAVWHARMGELLRQVCRVEIALTAGGIVTGTGFLVAPDLVLTNYHVAAVADGQAASAAGVRVRFDHAVLPGHVVPSQGTAVRLAAQWLAAWRPPSKVDDMAYPGAELPLKDELDFAFLRLAAPLPERGRVRLGRPGARSTGLVAGDWVIVLQHPKDAPLKQAFGQSLGQNLNKTRLRYKVTTERGSSGAPVLNERLEVVGLHHAGDPNFDPVHKPQYNAAIPVAAILDYLDRADQPLARELAS